MMGTAVLADPWFYAVSVPAVLLFGIAKGGFGGGLAVMSVPLMSLVMTPLQAAAILLPILCFMDLLTLHAYRGRWDWRELRVLLPASLLGIALGTMLFNVLSAATVKLIIGCVALWFTAHHFLVRNKARAGSLHYLSRNAGVLAGGTAGFTSMIAHSGGPPVSMYLLRRPLDRTQFIANAAVFFAFTNYVKLLPYGWLGQLQTDNLLLSVVLAPLAPIGIWLGVWMHRRVTDRFFFRFAYALLFVVALKLIYDGLGRF